MRRRRAAVHAQHLLDGLLTLRDLLRVLPGFLLGLILQLAGLAAPPGRGRAVSPAGAGSAGREQTRVLLHDLTAVHHLVTGLQQTGAPDLGPRSEVKPRF
jgi:hypothetical protein